ncbi:hypothetical protein FA13DRAFT_1034492 [Coprinellus micaceus]|uniref:Uncharacterized protein n=1 Tax=Coprinellus micaceus TaxID=71717 RepID=A0A4Y7RMP9_COPMI|nr:hypothetical protein FA13DRAFT_1034492 [Coprinellus micaceus]
MAIRSGKLQADGPWAFRPACWPRQTHVLGLSTTYAPPARDRWRTYLINMSGCLIQLRWGLVCRMDESLLDLH